MWRLDDVVRPPSRAPRRGRLSSAVLGWLVIAASLLVIGVAAAHTADLGPDPSWAFDCSDTTCTDLWSATRHHNATVAVVAAVGVALGWALVGTGMPRVRARYQGRGPGCGASGSGRYSS